MFVKICGITNEDDALLAVAMGASAIGFIFAPSTRQIAPTHAGDIAKRLPPEIVTFGVFRNEAKERVVQIVNRNGLSGAQLHGHESAEDTRWVADRIPRIMKAFAAGTAQVERAKEWGSDPILLDAPSPGSGEVFDWSLVGEAPSGLHIVLAGGLNPDNVAEAIRKVRPWGVDVSSGVEKSPGRKDAVALRQFIAEAHRAGAVLEGLAAKSRRGPTLESSESSAAGRSPSPGSVDYRKREATRVPYDWHTDG